MEIHPTLKGVLIVAFMGGAVTVAYLIAGVVDDWLEKNMPVKARRTDDE